MFYSVFVLGKKGPLARVWLAAHWDKKITKAQILETNIVESVDSILQPKVKLSLRTSSHLLLGIVRIYARKTLYLLQDCQDAAFKIKSAFRPGVVDLPDGKTEAAISAITLPEMFDFVNDFDLMAEPQMHVDAPTTTANIRNITLVEDISSIHVDDPLLMNEVREWSEIGSIGGGSINIKDGCDSSILNDSGISLKNNFDMFDRPALDDGFGGQIGIGIVDEDDVFGMPMPAPEEMNMNKDDDMMGINMNMENGHNANDDDNTHGLSPRPDSRMSAASDSMSFGGPPSIAPSGPPSTPGSPDMLDDVDPFNSNIIPNGNLDNQSMMEDDNADPMARNVEPQENMVSQNTMVLEPIDSQLGGFLEKRRKRRKKIGMVIDEVKTLSGEEMKAQLSDTSDIISNLDLAPPNKMLMNWKKTGLSDKLFSLPERTISAKVLFQYYSRNLITSRYDGTKENELADEDALLLNQDIPDEEHEMSLINGRLNESLNQGPLPELDDIEQHLAHMSPVHEIQAPKTPRAPKSPAPPRKKRKTEDKENKEVATKRPREAKYEKLNQLEDNRSESQLQHITEHNESNLLQDISSIQEVRAGSDARASSVVGGFGLEQPILNEESDEEKDDEEEEDEMFHYDAPMSVGPMEEMLPDETADQFEERMRTKRSNMLLKYMGTQLDEEGQIKFNTLIRNNKRKLVAQKFYALLVLKKQMAIELYQNPELPYSELTITKGHKYDEHIISSVA